MLQAYTNVVLFLMFIFLLIPNTYAQNKTIETSGDIFLFALPAAAFGTTLILKDKEGSWQFTKAFLVNEAVTFGLKIALNKPRPYNNGDNAFPSGHTSTTFQSASFIHRRYGFKYSIPVYIAAGFTAFSRINAQKHDGWDILAGAVVGIGSTYLFTTPYQQEHLELTMNSTNGNYLLGFVYKF
ncbi:PAP2 superfamily protein [Gillisia sp. Hel_I_86]|uniref:phosphatase PAP2 family protein n=1 Tax=Gillisia sp. Hel_I_86 TaxID=1249981 RepID=UPI00119A7406|nr:phosphatase PAP2 family protein [Gillisia sp. Hel_I_86]TVZ27692.1 PAP2 superfamily protein [Gillisia sp. Hel_I_86]